MKTCSIPDCDRKHYGQGYCSMHWLRWRRTGNSLTVRPHTVNAGCFQKGQPAHNKGVPSSDEAKRKNSEAKKRLYENGFKPSYQFPKGHTPINKGISHSSTTKEKIRKARAKQIISPDHGIKISNALAGKPKSIEHIAKISGENHYRWKGGTRRNMSKSEWRNLRQQVIERDNHCCQVCGRDNVTLVAHHIVHWPEGPDELNNLVAWCRSCHVRYHSKIKHSPVLM